MNDSNCPVHVHSLMLQCNKRRASIVRLAHQLFANLLLTVLLTWSKMLSIECVTRVVNK